MLQPQLQGPGLPEFATKSCVILFQAQVARDASKIAVACETEKLSFGALNSRANQLARYLRARGVTRETIVGICIDRSVEMAIGILGILKAGAAYLPIDPDYPIERLAFMLNDARPALVITKENSVAALSETSAQLVVLDRDWQSIALNDDTNLSEVPAPGDLAYVIYTSGSTGEPKGVMIEHGNLANYLLALNRELQITADDLYMHTASIAFSSSRRQLLLPLSQGAGVVIATSEQRKDPLALFRMIKQRGVTVMDAVPSFWRNCTTILESLEEDERAQLLDNKLRLMLSASEPMPADIPRTWLSQFNHPAQHVHMFGQTETAGIVCLYRAPASLDPAVNVLPVGNPIANTEMYLLDEEREPCPAGVAGEVYIGGAGVGRGYLNRPALTSEKFCQIHGHRLYRTGDWARVRDDGQIEFAGRRDQQVKLRGFRVELGEIEAALLRHPSVRECAVIARDQSGVMGVSDKRLIAYYVSQDSEVTAADLRAFLSARVPDYSVPAAFVKMTALPLSANGKVDRLRLPEPEVSRAAVSAEFAAPQNEIETRLARIWAEVLSVNNVGRDDNFFELGGHSLLAAQIAARIRSLFAFEAPISAVFEFPTIKLLAERIASGDGELIRSITPATRNETAPLSFNQQQFWLLDQVVPNRASYNVRTALKIDGPLQVEKLQYVIDCLVARHEILRTNIVVQSGTPVQVIASTMRVRVRLTDLSGLSAQEVELQRSRAFTEEGSGSFDLSNGPLFRARLLKFSDEAHELVLTLHHIVCDGWSINVLLRELTDLYLKNIDTRVLPQLSIQYADFAAWQRRWLQDEAIDRQLNYWKRQLADAPTALELPTDYSRPAMRTFEGGRVSAKLPADLTESLKSLSRSENVTLFMTLLAAFQTLLFRYSGQEDVVVGSPVAGRTMFETENLIGAFVNTLVLRADLSGNPSFREVLARVRRMVMGAFCHQDLPFEKLVEELNPERKANRSPLFQVMFSFQNMPEPELAVNGIKFTPINVASDAAKFDLTLEVKEGADGIWLSFEFAKDLFAPATIDRMHAHFQNLLTLIVTDPAKSIAGASLLTEAERQQLLIEWNNDRVDYPADASVHHLFELQVAKTPEATAVEFCGQRLTYRELNARANQLAHYLRRRGVGTETMVGISVERSLELIVGILAILKSGAAYVPLDPTYPRDRIAFMIDDTASHVVITQKHLAKDIVGDAAIICIDEEWQSISRESEANPNVQVSSSQLALVLYTSGSTGNPKGVMLEHRSLVNFATSAKSAYDIWDDDRILQFGSISFDLSAEEILLALTSGACLVLRTTEMISSPQDFLAACEAWKLSVLDLPTVYWHELTDALSKHNLTLPQCIRLVIIGGEKASADRVAVWNRIVGQKVRLLNTYGPTETTIAVTLCDLSTYAADAAHSVSPIGRPLPNTSVYVLDATRRPVPIGISGELHIGGPGVARGYLNRSDLTSQKFVENPFSDDPQSRLYKTGDMVRYHADGNIEFLGRVDNQIKIRGFRVELEEIERAIRSHDAIDDCVITVTKDEDKRLVAYIITAHNPSQTIIDLRKFLKTKLPSYMMPAAFEVIDEMPLMASGKINRLALPEPRFNRAVPDVILDVPTTPLEEMLLAAWQDVLKVDEIGVHDNFFDLGGHSLLAARLVSSVRSMLDVELNMVDVFESPTIFGLAELLYPRVAGRAPAMELARLLEEIAMLSDLEARLRLERELNAQSVAA